MGGVEGLGRGLDTSLTAGMNALQIEDEARKVGRVGVKDEARKVAGLGLHFGSTL